jgi:solute carrier family 35 protein C2
MFAAATLNFAARVAAVYGCAVLPNGAVTGLDIGFSNASLVHITMSFYTMCKSTTPIFLLAFAFIWRLET